MSIFYMLLWWVDSFRELLKADYDGKLQKSYDAPLSEVIGEIFGGLSSKKVITPGIYRTYALIFLCDFN